jgi:release factor glutamine methyltransferase
VRDREPRAALTGGADGLDVIRLIARGAKRRLRPAGALFLEIGAGQGKAAAGLVSEAGPWRSVAVLQDLADRDRFVIAQL